MKNWPRYLLVLSMLLVVFVTWSHVVRSDAPLIFQKDLFAHDESSNSVVAANLTRQAFPPMVRVNPLNPVQGNWMEGPFWQHIPPLFAYVPYVFFKLDGQVTIEVKRLSYSFLELLAGILFVGEIYLFSESLWLATAALASACVWLVSPFSRALVTGYAFGVSDIVLAFTCVCALGGLLWYLKQERDQRQIYGIWKLVLIAFFVALPIMAKNLLGAIPGALFFILLLYDHRRLNWKIFWSAAGFLLFLAAYYLPLYFASAVTFKKEILVAFFHLQNLEGWARPWHWYVTNYLPQLYLFKYTAVYFIGLAAAAPTLFFGRLSRQEKILLRLSLGWFVWNLVVISLVSSKVPNFIFQSYLFSLFAISATMFIWLSKIDWPQLLDQRFASGLLIIVLAASAWSVEQTYGVLRQERVQPYNYQTEHEKFYHTAELLRTQGLNTQDLIIVRLNNDDCWFRYYPLFLTGTESKTLLEMYFGYDPNRIKAQYRDMYFIVNKNEKVSAQYPYTRIELPDYSEIKYNLSDFSVVQIQGIINTYLTAHAADIQQNITEIKADKTSCQWLVPDAILNAP